MFNSSADLRLHARQLVKAGVRSSTARTYNSAQKRYLNFCSKFDLLPLPADEDQLLLYVAFLHQEGLKAATVRVYLAAVRSLHIEEGHGNPLDNNQRLIRALRALDITGDKPNQKLPITLDILQLLYHQVPRTYDGCVLWAAMTVGFFGCLRASEFCSSSPAFNPETDLCVGDVKFITTEDVPHMCMTVKHSKTDVRNKGFTVVLGCSSSSVCAYCSVQAMFRMKQHQGQHVTPQHPLFQLSSGLVLTKAVFVAHTRQYLSNMGLDAKAYSGHSFRAGSATSAAIAGLADWEIQVLGRWTSTAYQRYIRTPKATLVTFAQRLVQHRDAAFPFRSAFVSNVI